MSTILFYIICVIIAIYLLAGILFYIKVADWYRDIDMFVPCKINSEGKMVPIIDLPNWVWSILLTIIWIPWIIYAVHSGFKI